MQSPKDDITPYGVTPELLAQLLGVEINVVEALCELCEQSCVRPSRPGPKADVEGSKAIYFGHLRRIVNAKLEVAEAHLVAFNS